MSAKRGQQIQNGTEVKWGRRRLTVSGVSASEYRLWDRVTGYVYRARRDTVERNNPDAARVPLTE